MRSAATLLGLFVLGSLAFTACDGDDDTTSGTGGSSASGGSAAKGGSAGTGTGGSNPEGGESGIANGSSGKGGNNGVGGTSSGKGGTSSGKGGTSAGKGGTSAGKGGTGANGGNATGGGAGEGAAGAAAAAGDTGAGGTTGGTIGASGAGAGGDSGNNGGEAGSGGPAPSPKACTYGCTADEDCDPAHQITCVDGLCLNAGRACTFKEDCIGLMSTGLAGEPCTQDEDCPYFMYGDLCMEVGGAGLCLNPASSDCPSGGQPTLLGKFGSSDTAMVCLELEGRCDAHQCFLGCSSDPNFCANAVGNSARGPQCNAATGKCGGCTSNGDCGGPGTSHCNLTTGVCGCQVDNDCNGLNSAGLDTCIAGQCSCSASSCSTFPDATPICG